MVNYSFFGAKTRQKILFRKYIKNASKEYSEDDYDSDLSDEIIILKDSSKVIEIKPFDKYDHYDKILCIEDSDDEDLDDDILNTAFYAPLDRKMWCTIIETSIECDENIQNIIKKNEKN